MYADIAVPNVPKDTLTYGVPEAFEGIITAGFRVVVPLGRKPVMGFVVRLHDVKPEFSVKPVLEILDPRPVLSESLMRLCTWAARYYCCPLGDALKAALPQGMGIETERAVVLATDDEGTIAQAVGSSQTKRMIVDALRTGEVISESMLAEAVGLKSVSAPLRALEAAGVVAIESVREPPRVRPKTIRVARLLPPWNREEKIRELMEAMEKQAPKQVNVLAVLWQAYRQGKPTMPATDLVQAARTGSAQVRALEEKGIIEVLEEEIPREFEAKYEEIPKPITLTEDQYAAIASVRAALDERGFRAFLLHGVAASGKTQVYIDAIRHALDRGLRALVLVPEIALTPQLVFRFRHAFGKDVTVLHSRMSLGERYDAWRLTREGRYRIVIGVRSAVFAPLENLGLIVVDEEHESSYKQSDAPPRYHARDVAVMRASLEGAVILLGSATPSAESWHNAEAGKYTLLRMPHRIGDAPLPAMTMVDMIESKKKGDVHGALSRELVERIRAGMAAGETTILFHNRRGYAPSLECEDCGHTEECRSCSISMVYHKDRSRLQCHYCGAVRKPPAVCPRCGGTSLSPIGTGTQRVEEELRALIPEIRILRMDSDTTKRKGSHDLILTQFGEGKADVLLGTQMVAKGLDFERVTLVGVISAEQSLLFPDFRAVERTFQLLMQVTGRSGRGAERGEVVIQTRHPSHDVFTFLAGHDYEGFIEAELTNRREYRYPPYSRLVLLGFSSQDESKTLEAANEWHRSLHRFEHFLTCYPPQPALIRKIKNRYRYHVLIRVEKSADPDGTKTVAVLREAGEEVFRKLKHTSVRVDIDVDPQNLL
ncbi:MAG: primosomal protein N' [Bacteroidota bacterium]|nr:primosomal protein N' [Bacteroidota bacterium]